jgi:hypothetical protein
VGPRRPESRISEGHYWRVLQAIAKSKSLLLYGFYYLMCTPEMARATMSRWISSKIV